MIAGQTFGGEVLICNCGTDVVGYRADCPTCGRVVNQELFHRQQLEAKEELARRIRAREQRFTDLAASKIAIPHAGNGRDEALEFRTILAGLETRIAQLEQEYRRSSSESNANHALRAELEAWDIDPDSSLEALLETAAANDLAVDLYGAPWRAEVRQYRCTVYHRVAGCNERVVVTEAATGWAATAAAILGAFDRLFEKS